MLRKESEAVPEGNGPVPQQVGSGQPTLEGEYWREIEDILKRLGEASIEIKDNLRSRNQCVARLKQNAWQPCLAMEADGPANTKTRKCTEGVATAVQAMHGDSCSATRVDPGPKTNSTSFGVKAEPPALPCRDGVLVENGAASPKSCLQSLEMHSPSAAGGLLPTGETSTATKITVNRPRLRLHLTEEKNLRTSTQPVSYDSSFWNLLAAPICRKVIETKSMQNRIFDPGGFQGRLRACPFLGSWRAIFCVEVNVRAG